MKIANHKLYYGTGLSWDYIERLVCKTGGNHIWHTKRVVYGGWRDFEDSPLNYLITKKKSNFISVEQYLELNDIIKCATIFRRTNEKGSCEKASITSILKVN